MTKQKLLLFLFFFLCLNHAFSQHCGWDFSSILVIEIKDKMTNQLVEGLKISYCDSLGNVLKDYKKKPLICFHLKETKPYQSDENFLLGISGENYGLVVHADVNLSENNFLRIEDVQGRYAPVEMPLSVKEYLVPLCSSRDSRCHDKEVIAAHTLKILLESK
jgi:hypothetical protein